MKARMLSCMAQQIKWDLMWYDVRQISHVAYLLHRSSADIVRWIDNSTY